MKNVIFLSAFAVLSLTACHKSVETGDCARLPAKITAVTIEPSMKGWELYSWPGNVCGGWHFSILGGTNKLKTYASVTADTNLLNVSGITQLELLLDKFPQHETILWMGQSWLVQTWAAQSPGNLQLPPASQLQVIQAYCRQRDLELIILP